MPLQVIIVGGGISGVTAAVSLHQAGHKVQIYEKSTFPAEIGLAMACTPNGALALQKLGFEFPKAKGVQLDNWETIDGNTLNQIRNVDVSQSEKIYGASFRAIHRNDLFQGLLALAQQSDTTTNGERRSIKLNLDAKVVHVDVEKGSVTFEDGSVQEADLIVAADGVHSCVRPFVVDAANDTSTETGLSAYRFLIPRTVIHQSPAALRVLAKKLDGVGMYADTLNPDQERSLVWYACRGGDLYNFVCIHPKRIDAQETGEFLRKQFCEGSFSLTTCFVDLQSQLLQEYAHFHPDIVEILHLATDVRAWPLLARQPLVSWSKGKVVLIGDAAHPMLPFGGQGANQGIEDGATLGVFMRGIDKTTLPARLKAYVQFRTRRVARTQLLASVRPGSESLVIERIKEFMEPGVQLPDIFPKRVQHDSSYDAVAEAERCVAILGLEEP